MALEVRQATIADIEALVPLFDGYRTFYGFASDEALARSFLFERFRNLQSIVFIALIEGHACGFTQLYPSFSSGRAARTFILNDLFVSGPARKRGVGRALLAAAKNYARAAGAVRLMLSTATDNTTARSLYEAAGWQRETKFVTYNLPLE
jgi:GNAT superfamily N-acetyltransferase